MALLRLLGLCSYNLKEEFTLSESESKTSQICDSQRLFCLTGHVLDILLFLLEVRCTITIPVLSVLFSIAFKVWTKPWNLDWKTACRESAIKHLPHSVQLV